MGKVLKYSLFIIFELSLLSIIVILGFKIRNLYNGKVKGAQYVSYVDKKNLIFDPENKQLKYFYEPKPNSIVTLKPEWLGYEVKNYINSDGLNELTDYSSQKPKNTFRVITLGDSFTYGWYVNSGETWSDYLGKSLNKELKCKNYSQFEVINLGVHGYDIEYSEERYRKRGIKYDPDLIIWLINNWNFGRINEEARPLREKLEKDGIPNFDPVSKKFLAAEKTDEILLNKYGEQYILDYQKNILSKIDKYYKGKLVIVSFPDLSGKYRKIINNLILLKPNYLYFDNLFDPRKADGYHLLDEHPNKEGHKKMAEKVSDYIHTNILTDCFSVNDK